MDLELTHARMAAEQPSSDRDFTNRPETIDALEGILLT